MLWINKFVDGCDVTAYNRCKKIWKTNHLRPFYFRFSVILLAVEGFSRVFLFYCTVLYTQHFFSSHLKNGFACRNSSLFCTGPFFIYLLKCFLSRLTSRRWGQFSRSREWDSSFWKRVISEHWFSLRLAGPAFANVYVVLSVGVSCIIQLCRHHES